MNSIIRTVGVCTLLTVGALCSATVVSAQEKRVNILRLEVDGKPVEADIKVQIITPDKKVHEAKADKKGFFVPESVAARGSDEFVGVIIKFKKHVLTFFTVHTSNFNVDWSVVGVDKEPFDTERLGKSDPSEVEIINYIEFADEPGRNLIVVKSKPKITVRRIN